MNLETFQNYVKLRNEVRSQMYKEGKGFITQGLQEIIKGSPVHAVQFKTWTPTFNDGDPCYFCTTFKCMDIAIKQSILEEEKKKEKHKYLEELDYDEDEEGEYLWVEEGSRYDYDDSELKKTVDALNAFAANFDDGLIEMCFGSGERITVTQTKVIQDDYNCGY